MVFGRLFVLILSLLLISCGDEPKLYKLNFSPTFQGDVLNCNESFSNENIDWQLSQLQFFISHIELQDLNDNWQALPLKSQSKQSDNIVLLGQDCEEKNSSNWIVSFVNEVADSQFKKVRFSLGVPFELNHLNPLVQSSPLNDSSMFWVWQTGHKFVRFELENEETHWLFHLGSTGCKSPSVMRSPIKNCLNPNLFIFEASIGSNGVEFDMTELLDGISLHAESSCQSSPENPSCQRLFMNMRDNKNNKLFKGKDEI